MTFAEFKNDVTSNVSREPLRKGQYLMVKLHEVRVELYYSIVYLKQDIDCFYNNAKIESALSWLESVW